jgi:peptidoglycan-associated lipoprotein
MLPTIRGLEAGFLQKGVEMRYRGLWRIVCLTGLIGILSLLCSLHQSAQGWQVIPEESVFLYPSIDGVGYLTKKDPPHIGQILTPRTEKSVLVGEDVIVYCDAGTRDGVKVGDKLLAFSVLDHRWLKGYREVEIQGRLTVIEVNEGECAALVEEAYKSLSIGSWVDYFRPLEPRIPLKKAPEWLQGQILWSEEGINLAQGEVVYLDKGSVDGVAPGQCYEIYRVPAEDSGAPTIAYEERRYHTEKPPPEEHLSTVVGELMVLRTEETTSTALITMSELPLSLGDRFRAGCALEEQLLVEKEEAAPSTTPSAPPPPIEEEQREAFENVDVNFAFDSYVLDARARDILAEKARFLQTQSAVTVLIEGHCDERGTEQYNLALGDRRAHAAKQYLIGLGIAGNRMNTVSYGEERPLDPGHNEEAWAKNRRAHFVIQGR